MAAERIWSCSVGARWSGFGSAMLRRRPVEGARSRHPQVEKDAARIGAWIGIQKLRCGCVAIYLILCGSNRRVTAVRKDGSSFHYMYGGARDGQSHPHTFLLGCEEGLEQLRQPVNRYAGAGVGDSDFHRSIVARFGCSGWFLFFSLPNHYLQSLPRIWFKSTQGCC